ncbi:MAG TPA: hypothetical protein PKE69_20275 [Pyrinomonadaceae bacterium]|nr:hypothetical protein [Pyrinomonadaceae bacterium]
MKNFITSAFLIMFGLIFVVSAQSVRQNVNLNKEFTLSANEKGFLKTGKITLEFVSVLEDSRCPIDVDCVWAGSAKIQIKLSKGKATPQTFELNTGIAPQFIIFKGYRIEILELSPSLKSDDDRTKVKYEAKFIFKK